MDEDKVIKFVQESLKVERAYRQLIEALTLPLMRLDGSMLVSEVEKVEEAFEGTKEAQATFLFALHDLGGVEGYEV